MNLPWHSPIGIPACTAAVLAAGVVSATGPAAFIRNDGQVKDQNGSPNGAALFVRPGEWNNVVLRAGGFSYDTYTTSLSWEQLPAEGAATARPRPIPLPGSSLYQFHRVDIDFVGGDPLATIEPLDPEEGVSHYYTGATPVTDVPSFRRVVMRNVWPHIDIEFKSGEVFEYDFILRPGSDLNDIRLRYTGMLNAELTDGILALSVEAGVLSERIPMSYFTDGAQPVEVRYTLQRVAADNAILGFSGPSATIDRTLVIDPTPNLDWGTYYGGTNWDEGVGLDTDAAGNVIATGYTMSATLIATAGAHQSTYAADWDAYAVKLNPAGVRQWATYLGGPGSDYGYAVACDGTGNTYWAGYGGPSTTVSSAGAHQSVHGGSFADAFLLKLSSAGTRSWGTFYGGVSLEFGYDIAVDPTGANVYLAGSTISLNNIATAGAHTTTLQGTYDAFLVKFSAAGVRQWGTYFGGLAEESAHGVAVDGAGNVIICGYTTSANNIATAGAFQSVNGSPAYKDSFIEKFSPAGVRLWGTYYGGTGEDTNWEVACDAANNIVVVGGTTTVTNYFGTAGAHDPTFNGTSDAYISKFTSAGVRLWSTHYGSTGYDWGYGLAIDPSNAILVAGTGEGGAGVSTPGSAQPLSGGLWDAYVMKFDPNGARQWATYYGGSGYDFANDVTLFGSSAIYINGSAGSPNNMATPGAHQTVYGTNQDGFVAKFGSGGSPLPIELLSFTARPIGADRVLTEWSTAVEIDNDRFHVERSADGVRFVAVGEVDGAENSQSTLHYAWTDADPLAGLSYYRLRQTDFDGTSTTSDAMPVMRNGESLLQALTIRGALTLTLSAAARVDVMDPSGRIVHRASLNEGTHTLGTLDWSPGVYQVIAHASGSPSALQRVVIAQ